MGFRTGLGCCNVGCSFRLSPRFPALETWGHSLKARARRNVAHEGCCRCGVIKPFARQRWPNGRSDKPFVLGPVQWVGVNKPSSRLTPFSGWG